MPSDKAKRNASSSAGPLGLCGRGLGVTQTRALRTYSHHMALISQAGLPVSQPAQMGGGGKRSPVCVQVAGGRVWSMAIEVNEQGVYGRRYRRVCVCLFHGQDHLEFRSVLKLEDFWISKNLFFWKNLNVWLILAETWWQSGDKQEIQGYLGRFLCGVLCVLLVPVWVLHFTPPTVQKHACDVTWKHSMQVWMIVCFYRHVYSGSPLCGCLQWPLHASNG